MNKSNTWYVAFRRPKPGAYIRNSEPFQTEMAAKEFARERLAEGYEVTAGTINPHTPKRIITSWDIMDWLDRE